MTQPGGEAAPPWAVTLQSLPELSLRKEWIGKPAPDLTLKDLEGNVVALSALRGKVVLLNFWSVTCPPCLRELPMLNNAALTHGAALSLWGITSDPPDRDRAWIAAHQPGWRTLSDPEYAVADRYQVHGIPATVLIGRDGKIEQYWDGPATQEDLTLAIDQALRAKE